MSLETGYLPSSCPHQMHMYMHARAHTHTHTLVSTRPPLENQAFPFLKVCPVAKSTVDRCVRPIRSQEFSPWPPEPSSETGREAVGQTAYKTMRTCQIGEGLALQSMSCSAEQMSPPVPHRLSLISPEYLVHKPPGKGQTNFRTDEKYDSNSSGAEQEVLPSFITKDT